MSSDRQIGPGGVGPLTFLAIDAYARRYGIESEDEFDQFLYIMRMMDGFYLTKVHPPKNEQGEPHQEIESTDVTGIKSLLKRKAAIWEASRK